MGPTATSKGDRMSKGSELALALVAEIDRLERELERAHGDAESAVRLLRATEKERDAAVELSRRHAKTGLFNLRAFEEFVRASRWDGYYVFADGDGIGALNKDPEVGHDRVDEEIAAFAQWLRRQVRYVRGEAVEWDGVERRRRAASSDAICCCFGGDEFLVWSSSQKGALRIRNAIRRYRSAAGVTWSAGMGQTRKDADERCSAFKLNRKGTRFQPRVA